jgi:hypothetical protein
VSVSPTQRTLKYLRDSGWPVVQVVEHHNPYSNKKVDLFGFGDVAALHPDMGMLIVQVTSGSNVSARMKKIRTEALLAAQIAVNIPGVSVEIHGWRKVFVCTTCGKAKGTRDNDKCQCEKTGRRRKWMPRIIKLTSEDLHD